MAAAVIYWCLACGTVSVGSIAQAASWSQDVESSCSVVVRVDALEGKSCDGSAATATALANATCSSLQDVLRALSADASTELGDGDKLSSDDCVEVLLCAGEHTLTQTFNVTHSLVLRGELGGYSGPGEALARGDAGLNLSSMVKVEYTGEDSSVVFLEPFYFLTLSMPASSVVLSGVAFQGSDRSGILSAEGLRSVAIEDCSFRYSER